MVSPTGYYKPAIRKEIIEQRQPGLGQSDHSATQCFFSFMIRRWMSHYHSLVYIYILDYFSYAV